MRWPTFEEMQKSLDKRKIGAKFIYFCALTYHNANGR